MSEILPWKKVASEAKGDYRIFRTRIDRCESPETGETHPFVVVDCNDWVNVVAITPDDEIVFVRQYRFGTEEVTLELPGGAVDPGEDFLTAGVRELAEETGYEGDAAKVIGVVTPNPAFINNRCGTLLVPNAHKAGPARPEGTEILETVLIPRDEVIDRVQRGDITHALVVAAILWMKHPSQAGT